MLTKFFGVVINLNLLQKSETDILTALQRVFSNQY